MKHFFIFLLLACTFNMYAETITVSNDKLGTTLSASVGDNVVVDPKAGYLDPPDVTFPNGSYVLGIWSFTVSTSGAYGIGYGGENTKINVYPASVSVESVSLNPTSLSGQVGGSGSLTATVNPANATDKSVTWSSSNSSVASVTNGAVSYTGVGSATITVKTNDGNHTATANVAVSSATVSVTSVSLNLSSLSGVVGGSGSLTATVNPSNATDKSVTWQSSNPSVASVTNGTVSYTGVGNATITVKTNDGNYTATCTITVDDVPAGLILNSGIACKTAR
jgi:uncharacterized protein YjdB